MGTQKKKSLNMNFSVVALIVAVALCATAAHAGEVKDLPGAYPNMPPSYSGYITVEETNEAKLFYWFFPSQSDPANDPVLLWMTGGPGCSSELAIAFENGQFSIEDPTTLKRNPYSWNNQSSVLYIDQPFGTGFSPLSIDIVSNEDEVALYVYRFLQGFFAEFPSYADNKFFGVAESYGGHYMPAVAAYIVAQNQAGINRKINLKGIAIGNGWVDPLIQNNYCAFAKSLGWMSGLKLDACEANYAICADLLGKASSAIEWLEAEEVCGPIFEEVILTAPKVDGYHANTYNYKEPCVVPGLCYDFTNQTDYFNNKVTQAALGVDMKWETCSTLAGLPLLIDRERSYRFDIPLILAGGVPVLIYNGMLDVICNWDGGLEWATTMPWPSQAQWAKLPLENWVLDGAVAGHTKSYNGFTFMAVENAGHMVPHDQPAVALAMINTFMAGGSF